VARPRAAGEVELQGPTVTRTSPDCPEPRRRTLSLSSLKASVTWDDGRLVLQPLTTGLGRGTVATKLTATATPPMTTELSDLVLKGIPLERVLVDFLCQGYAVSGALDLTGGFTLAAGDPLRTLAGAGQLRVGPGQIVGASALTLLSGIVRLGTGVTSVLALDVPRLATSSPLEFESIVGTYQVRNGIVTTRDLLYTSRAMKVRVAGDYALATARVSLDVVVDDGRRQLQAKVTGPAAAPAIRVEPVAILRQLDAEKAERDLKDLLKKFR
jgi:AsmA-like protein